ncbi:hypothetical protein CWR48_04515 [Oceanobacillus arenosus]|uniref:Nucleoside triphosphate/diphosphate phosphatase n=1 Tax=Oceanobacillus arenosus TaxID=1229153 RepID=A0A3D8PXQ0_9BACI|nr:DUF402 domain-containing protein [Oceanobacillus arenosus]RDW20873.1 hypothetical protein CWR48_04515 [Oceanobacillus arenosus]
MVAPKAGSNMQIQSYKHNGQLHRIWENTIVLKGTETVIIGANDKTPVIESDGRTWITREPAICYFHSKYWFNIIAMIREDGIHYYCNISSPFVYDEEALKYIDYDLDLKVFPDMTFKILDEDEYDEHKRQMNYPLVLDRILHHNMEQLIKVVRMRRGPFAPDFVDSWYERFLTYR